MNLQLIIFAIALACIPASALEPIAIWSFEDPDALALAGPSLPIAGPRPPEFPAMLAQNQALAFDGDGTYVRVDDATELRFGHGDAITIEAWLLCEQLGNGQHAYIIGKGRTQSDRDNQNWAMRVTGSGSGAAISFLFRSQPNESDRGRYHRWTSSMNFPLGEWYHVAISYVFGEPESVRGYIDGLETKGNWDMGGATTRPPVVDDNEIWIGSARGGGSGNGFHGGIDEIAIYRGILSAKDVAGRSLSAAKQSPPDLSAVPTNKVLAEVHDAAASPRLWLKPNPETLALDAFALLDLPNTYADGGVRADRRLPLFVRLAAEITLPAGDYEFLLRVPGFARVTMDEQEIASVPAFELPRDGHNELRSPPSEDDRAPRLPVGSRETIFDIHADGKPHMITAETLLGRPGRRFTVNQFLLAFRPKHSPQNWYLLGPQPIEFSPLALENYRMSQRASFDEINDARRTEADDAVAELWHTRHAEARAYIADLPALVVPGADGSAVDRYILAKIDAAQSPSADQSSTYDETILPLLETNCLRCHGKKEKGGLRLDSRSRALASGDSGEFAVIPGHPDKSALIRRVQSDDPDEHMPPKGAPLSETEIGALSKWIAEGAPWSISVASVELPAQADDLTLLRRLYLDTVGVLPPSALCVQFPNEHSQDKWQRLVDQLLTDSRHADHWVSYWQDVLAENPRLVKGKLNNTGPFRWWIHDSLRDNKPFDQFVTELVTFAGSKHAGGAAGFGIATENDAPMAAKAHVLGTAFLGMEMKCARCHDAPYHSIMQNDLFSLAAMLENKAITLPESSTVPTAFFENLSGRKSLIEATLKPGTVIEREWPFEHHATSATTTNARETLAREITHPANHRFAQVIVNRLWDRYFGQGIVEPVDDWEGQTPSHPELLEYLAREFVANGYDLRHIHRLILTSETYRRVARTTLAKSHESRFFEAPLRRRVSAEQLVDSLFSATGVPFYSEELSYDPEGAHPPDVMQSLGKPRRAWQMNAVSSERDRPSLTLPRASSIIAVMEAFGWRTNRSEPVSERGVTDNVIQPGMLGNGLFGLWLTRLSDHSDLTKIAVSATSPNELVNELYLRFLTRYPSTGELSAMLALIVPGFEQRLTQPGATYQKVPYVPEVRQITWATHLSVGANLLAADLENEAALGPPPTAALNSAWRECLEDLIWALVNSPEMQFMP